MLGLGQEGIGMSPYPKRLECGRFEDRHGAVLPSREPHFGRPAVDLALDRREFADPGQRLSAIGDVVASWAGTKPPTFVG
jgi:hypothetical protein